MIKVGFIGFNKSAHRYHLPFISEVEGFDVVGYYSRTNTAFEMPYKLGYKYYSSVNELLKKVDLVVVTTPPSFHNHYTKLALEHDCHVICEKPFVNTKQEAIELFALATQKQKKLFVYQNRRYDSDFLSVFKNIDLVGNIYEIQSNHTYLRNDNLVTSSNKYDGFVYGHAVHFIDQIVSVYGRPNDVVYDIRNIRNPKQTFVEDYYDINLIYDTFKVKVYFDPNSHYHPDRFIIKGSEGTIIKKLIDAQEEFLKQGLYPNNPNFGIDDDKLVFYQDNKPNLELPVIHQHYTQYYKNVYDCIKNNEPEFIKHQEVIWVLEILETIVNGGKYAPNN